jgi:hypothetical protein
MLNPLQLMETAEALNADRRTAAPHVPPRDAPGRIRTALGHAIAGFGERLAHGRRPAIGGPCA